MLLTQSCEAGTVLGAEVRSQSVCGPPNTNNEGDVNQLIFYILEWARGKPLPIRWRERIQQIGVLFLVFLMLFVMISDIERWISGG